MNKRKIFKKKQPNKPRKKIDYSDIPETNETFWANAEIHVPENKKSITLRLDPDVLAWYKEIGKGYQTKMNSVLRLYMLRHRHSPTQDQVSQREN